MKKYFAVARAEWLDALQNREEVLIWVILEGVPVLIMSWLWLANQSQLANLHISVGSLVTYYTLIFIISRVTGFYFDETMQSRIREGTFSSFLLRPWSLFSMLLSQNLGGKLFNTFFLLIPVLAFIYLLFGSHLLVTLDWRIVLFFLSLIPAYLIQFCLSLIVVAVAFFWEQSFSLIHLRWVMETVFGGYALPLYLYPKFLSNFASFLPFKYVYFLPANIYSSQLDVMGSLQQILYSCLWVVCLYLLANLIWRKGLNRYSSVGG